MNEIQGAGQSIRLKLRILGPIVVVFVAMLGAFTVGAYRLQARGVSDDMRQRVDSAMQFYRMQLDEDAAVMAAELEVLKQDTRYRHDWLAGDRAALLSRGTQLLERLRTEHRVTHLYFHSPDGRDFLRVHAPDRRGDLITRRTMSDAARAGEPARGVELGPLGHIALRIVHPWYVEGELVGYVELAKPVEQIVSKLRTILDVEIAVIAKKELLPEHTMEGIGDWVVIEPIMGAASAGVERIIQDAAGADPAGELELSVGKRHLHVSCVPMSSTGRHDFWDMVLVHDITEARTALNEFIITRAAGCTAAVAILTAIFWAILSKIENGLSAARRQLARAKDVAESSAAAKGVFLANMSHEIRTPMTAVLGFTEQLLDGGQSAEERRTLLGTVRRSGEHVLRVINDILDISKIEAGGMTVERIDCNVCTIISRTASTMALRAKRKGIAFGVECATPIPETIQSDPTRLQQILINLIENALKFTETGSVRVVLRTAGTDDEPQLELYVIDTGPGMTEEQVKRLFAPFAQADSSTTRRFGGSGLGLSLCRHFTRLLGGDAYIHETAMGKGTTVRASVATGCLDGVKMIDDPLASAEQDDAAGKSDDRLTRLDEIRILLAEDGPDNQRLITHLLEKAGAQVAVVEDGRRAVHTAMEAVAKSMRFDTILLDMHMPVMDGYEAARTLRRKGYDGHIIALTAHAMAGDREKCIEAGCNDYATKPIDRVALLSLIRAQAPVAVPA